MLIPQLDNCSEVMAVVYRATLSRDVGEGSEGGGAGGEDIGGGGTTPRGVFRNRQNHQYVCSKCVLGELLGMFLT